MTINSLATLNLLKSRYGTEMTKKEIADELGISLAAVTGTMNALIKKGYATTTREETVELEPATETRKAKVQVVKYHMLTDAGLTYDPEAEEAAKLAAKEAEKAEKAAARAAAKAAKEAANA